MHCRHRNRALQVYLKREKIQKISIKDYNRSLIIRLPCSIETIRNKDNRCANYVDINI